MDGRHDASSGHMDGVVHRLASRERRPHRGGSNSHRHPGGHRGSNGGANDPSDASADPLSSADGRTDAAPAGRDPGADGTSDTAPPGRHSWADGTRDSTPSGLHARGDVGAHGRAGGVRAAVDRRPVGKCRAFEWLPVPESAAELDDRPPAIDTCSESGVS